MRLIKSRTVQNAKNSRFLRLPGELCNTIYETLISTVTLTQRHPHRQRSRAHRKQWNRCFQLENAGHNLTQICRQIRYDTIGYRNPKPLTLILPFNVDLDVLLDITDFSYFSEVRTIMMTDKLAKRFRGLCGRNYRGVRVNSWERKRLVRRSFPSVERVMVKKVWRNLEETVYSLITLFDKLHLEVKFYWDKS